MRMVMDSGEEIISPDGDRIEEALSRLEEEEGKFARLEENDIVFIQTGRHDEDDYVLEYSDGETVEQTRQRLSWDEVVGAFQQFSEGDMDWRNQYKWGDIQSMSGMANWWWPLLAAVLIMIAFALFR